MATALLVKYLCIEYIFQSVVETLDSYLMRQNVAENIIISLIVISLFCIATYIKAERRI